jgi:hypothetical protein
MSTPVKLNSMQLSNLYYEDPPINIGDDLNVFVCSNRCRLDQSSSYR